MGSLYDIDSEACLPSHGPILERPSFVSSYLNNLFAKPFFADREGGFVDRFYYICKLTPSEMGIALDISSCMLLCLENFVLRID